MKNEFLDELAALCEKYTAEFEYTYMDDGIHIRLDEKEIFVGWLNDSDAAETLRAAKSVREGE